MVFDGQMRVASVCLPASNPMVHRSLPTWVGHVVNWLTARRLGAVR